MEEFTVVYNRDKGESFVKSLKDCRTMNLYFIGSTETSTIPGISIAGASPKLTLYTPTCDVEYLVHGKSLSFDAIPITPEGIPTPALITRAALMLSKLPYLVVDTGSHIEPKIPHISLPSKCAGKRIDHGEALPYEKVKGLYCQSATLAKLLSPSCDLFVIGESIPGGTTTTLGILAGLGYNAWGMVSSAGPNNPHKLKESVVKRGLTNSKLSIEEARKDPFKAVSALGDPVHVSIAGLLSQALSEGVKVILAGGTQMAAVLAIAKHLGIDLSHDIAIATTRWLINDQSSNIIDLVKMISLYIPIIAVNLDFSLSPFEGLRYYEKGYVKEGVGAGGTTLASLAVKNTSLQRIVYEIYREYNRLVVRSREISGVTQS